jgi:phosphotransferase system HPr (HPr) family protein
MARPAGDPVVRRVEVLNRAGLHARPATMLAIKAKEYDSEVELVLVTVPADHHLDPGTRADAKNSIELISLGAPQGTTLDIEAVGPDAGELVAALVDLFESHFGLEDAS